MADPVPRGFASSRVGWRVFGLFLLAAALPIALIAALTDHAVDAAWREGQTAIASNTAKAAALQALDRLQVAEQVLASAAGSSRAPPAMATALAAGRAAEPLAAVVEVAADGSRRVVRGGTRADPLLALPLPEPSASARGQSRLLAAGAPGGASADVVLLHGAAPDGRRWLGLVDPAFLWEDASELPHGMWLCAVTADRARLFCSDAQRLDSARSLARRQRSDSGDAPPHAVKELFLAAQFDAPGWTFVTGLAPGEGGFAALAGSVVPTAALASLLLVAVLSLVQIRRTLTPLARLADGARQVAQRQYGARVEVRSADEFGELAEAFNDMAARIEGQFAELGTLAAVDRQIVEQQGVDAAFATIARRIAELLPGRCVAVGRATTADGSQVLLQRAGPVDGARALVVDAALADALEAAGAAPAAAPDVAPDAALASALGWPGLDRVLVLPMRWRERRLGFIAVAQRGAAPIAAETMRQLVELRDRAAVAANAAEREERLVHEARHDTLTGLLNRSGLIERLDALLARPGEAPLAVLVLDLDRFKAVNDSLGHAAGDQALRLAAARIRRCIGEQGTVARRAGDEFVVLLHEPASPAAAAQVAQALCASMASAVSLEEQPFVLGGSVGIAVAAAGQTSSRELLRQADHAMYEAKKRGGGRFAFFDPRQDAQAQRRAWMERDLPLAAQRGELALVYQPRVEARGGAVRSVEALLRWHHPEHGTVPPGEFIPLAEQGELIEHIGAWVIDTACAQIAAWRAAGLGGLRVAVNLSARQLDSARLESDLDGALARHGIGAGELELEITESVFVDHAETTIARLQALRKRGMTIALDDFGTGYSSMAYLRRLPLDIVKIDRAFVQDLGNERSALAVAQAIVTLAGALDMAIVAEGVETPAQFEVLRELGCGELQGFLFSRPLAPDALMAWLAARETVAEPAVEPA